MKRCRGRRRRSLLPPLPLRDRHGFSITQNSHHNKQTGNIHKTRKHTQDGTNQTTTPTNRTQTPPNKPHPQNPTQRNPHNTHTTQPNPHHNTTKQPTPNNPHQTKKQKRGQEGKKEGQKRGQGGIEPPTSSTLRRNHATRPLSRICLLLGVGADPEAAALSMLTTSTSAF